ncbi:MAG: hypothetical protein PUB18_05610, partial [bacterium]|nr:hypothetical protein [bacterium]
EDTTATTAEMILAGQTVWISNGSTNTKITGTMGHRGDLYHTFRIDEDTPIDVEPIRMAAGYYGGGMISIQLGLTQTNFESAHLLFGQTAYKYKDNMLTKITGSMIAHGEVGSDPTLTADNMIKPSSVYNLAAGYYTGGAIGVDLSDATLTDSDARYLLKNKKAWGISSTGTNTLITGSMENQGAVNKTLTKNDHTYKIPAGYHNGEGTVSAMGLYEQGKAEGIAEGQSKKMVKVIDNFEMPCHIAGNITFSTGGANNVEVLYGTQNRTYFTTDVFTKYGIDLSQLTKDDFYLMPRNVQLLTFENAPRLDNNLGDISGTKLFTSYQNNKLALRAQGFNETQYYKICYNNADLYLSLP